MSNKSFKVLTKIALPVYVLLTLASFYHFYYAKRIIPGVKVGSVKVGGMTYAQASSALKKKEGATTKELPLKYNKTSFVIKGSEIDLRYDFDASVSRAFEIGRTGNVLSDSKDKLAGLVKSLYIAAFYDYTEDALNTKFSLIKGELNDNPKDAKVVISGDKLAVTPSKEGLKVVDDGLYKVVIGAFDRIDFSEKTVPVAKAEPNIRDDEVTPLLAKTEQMVFNNLKIAYEGKTWNLTPQNLLDFLAFKRGNGTVYLALDEPRFETFVDEMAQEINALPRGQVTRVEGRRVTEFKIIKEGKELDEKQFVENFKDAFFNVKQEVAIPVKNTSMLANKEQYGIYALLGEGTSRYTGSASGRIHNLTLAAERTNGVMVPPGGIYSMNNSVGEISAQTGYDTAYIISNGRTVLGEGGGVCQTSTTLFRAVLNSGLPIVMRYPHAYRVGYYELDSPVGLDATVFQPSIDFQFKNDTPNYVLVQSSSDLSAQTLTFRIYGTPDGRDVTISEPVVTNVTPPPAPLYQDDATLAKGVVRQVDFSAWGANVSFTRTVKKNNQVLYDDQFSSRYQPWRAVYLVGTKK